MNPAISVVIPAYKVSEWIGEALDSVFRQTYAPLEVFVVDQDMDEKMDAVLAPYGGRIIRLSLHRPSLPAARNLAIRQARGSIIAQLDGDDVWEPNALETLVGMLIADPGLDVVFPNAVFFGEPALEGKLFSELFPATRPVTYEDVVTRRTYIFGGLMYRKAAVERVGLFDESVTFGEDFDLWVRMIRAGSRFEFTSEPVYRYRRRPSAMCNDPVIGRLDSMIGLYDKQLNEPGLTESQRTAVEQAKNSAIAEQALARAKQLLATRDFAGAREQVQRANEYRRSLKLGVIATLLRCAPSLVGALASRRGL